ncbi:MAG: isoprenylcysteine carboxylmethyltransferase family protein [Candidatus Marinimicrobia bacterium]|nr:isoprenylcysteine carboxylmethyltransferase family protein [Candidatus Neomarinimicrobiota bacterium]
MGRRKKHRDNSGRPDLIGEHRYGDAGQLIFFAVFMMVWAGDSFFLRLSVFLNEIIPLYIRLLPAAWLLVCSAYLAMESKRIIFREHRDPPVVVNKEIYAKIRHPMYLSELLLYLGFIFLSLSLAAIIVWLIGGIFLYFLCRHEEKLLLEYFGESYREYMRETPMWIPCRLRKKKT